MVFQTSATIADHEGEDAEVPPGATAGVAEAAASAGSVGGNGAAALPPGWQAVATPEGETYYWQPETGEVSWELPGLTTARL